MNRGLGTSHLEYLNYLESSPQSLILSRESPKLSSVTLQDAKADLEEAAVHLEKVKLDVAFAQTVQILAQEINEEIGSVLFMTPDPLLSRMPALLENNPKLFTQQDLQDLEQALATIEIQSDDEAAETLAAFYRTHRHIRDALRNLSSERWGVGIQTSSEFDLAGLQRIVGRLMATNNIDSYLIHEFDFLETQQEQKIGEGIETNPEPIHLPMLIHVTDLSWNARNTPDCQVTYRMGNIIGCVGTRATIEALHHDPSVISVEASRPAEGWDSDPSVPTHEGDSSDEGDIPSSCVSTSVSLIKADLVHQIPETGDAALVAIIDSGIDILHDAFLDATRTRTRILAIWDQTDNTEPSPNIPDLLSIGTEHTEAQINQYIQTGTVPPSLGRDPAKHGTHVASIAAGRPGKHFPGGVAPDAKIVVIIPRIQTDPKDCCSIGYSETHLSALQYIKHIANQNQLPVVVNVSQGMNAGAHDGTSLLELGFDAFSGGGRETGYVIVKSAGNERNQQNHAKFYMASDSSDCLRWHSQAGIRKKDVIELWFKSANTMRFCLKHPSGEKSDWVTPKTAKKNSFSAGNSYLISYERYHKDNGDSRLLISITAGLFGSIDAGEWELQIESLDIKSSSDAIHAWIERGNQRGVTFLNHVNEEITLSIPGTARTVISVGSVNASKPFRVADYSAYGPTRDGRHQPNLAAPGEAIKAALACSGNQLCEMSGTSMAAPHVTGAIALLLSSRAKQCMKQPELEQFNAAQIRAVISQVTHNHNGHWHNGMGFGVLDVNSLLTAFDCI